MDSEAAQKRWLAENEVAKASSSDIDALYRWDSEEQRKIQNERPWRQDPHHFKK
jgi:COP9 signalosome complex subunit 5